MAWPRRIEASDGSMVGVRALVRGGGADHHPDAGEVGPMTEEPCQHPNVYVHEPVPSIRICADCGADLSAVADRDPDGG